MTNPRARRPAPRPGGRPTERDLERQAHRQARPATARQVALRCLQRIEDEGAYANLVVPAALAESRLETRDRAFATELVYGSTRMRRACDALVDRFVISEPDAATRSVLRLGAYQLVFANVAPHAAVSETVALAPQRTRGFVNAVLRNISRTTMIWPDRATELSYPDWIVERMHAELGDDAEAALEQMNVAPPVSVRDDGYTQDLASQWVAAAVGAEPGERVFDVCAAPGGKSTAMAGRGAWVVAGEIGEARAGLVMSNVERLGASDVAVVRADGTVPPFATSTFDRVLLDAPCSGLGALRRRPDARWRIRPVDVEELAVLQRRLLDAVAPLVRPGGTLVYSVCTVTAAESIDHPVPAGFQVIDEPPAGTWRPYGHGFRVLPQDADTDGMVIVRYRRTHD